MLVLSRHQGETVIIADGAIKVTVVDIRGDKVRIGFEADPNIEIHRQEVWEAIQKEKQDGEAQREAAAETST
jgi:carbon storage regulator